MKIFYKKDYERVLEEKNNLRKDYQKEKEEYKKLIDNTTTKIDTLSNLLKQDETMIIDLNEKIKELKSKVKYEQGAKGGLTKQVHKLEDKIKELKSELTETKKQLKESMSDKYRVKKIPSGKTPTQKIKLKSQMKPAVRKFLKEENE